MKRERKKKGPTILIIEDERRYSFVLQDYLEHNGYETMVAKSGEEGLVVLDNNHIDLLLLDLMLPHMNGLDVCREIREVRGEKRLPIIVISSKYHESEKVEALDQGADDYMTKPLSMDELAARIRRNLHRSNIFDVVTGIVVAGPFRLDTTQKRVYKNEQEVVLLPIEYKLMEFFINNIGRILTYDTLLRSIWSNDYDADEHRLQVHISNLRQKIELDPKKPRFITIKHGIGYQFDIKE